MMEDGEDEGRNSRGRIKLFSLRKTFSYPPSLPIYLTILMSFTTATHTTIAVELCIDRLYQTEEQLFDLAPQWKKNCDVKIARSETRKKVAVVRHGHRWVKLQKKRRIVTWERTCLLIWYRTNKCQVQIQSARSRKKGWKNSFRFTKLFCRAFTTALDDPHGQSWNIERLIQTASSQTRDSNKQSQSGSYV